MSPRLCIPLHFVETREAREAVSTVYVKRLYFTYMYLSNLTKKRHRWLPKWGPGRGALMSHCDPPLPYLVELFSLLGGSKVTTNDKTQQGPLHVAGMPKAQARMPRARDDSEQQHTTISATTSTTTRSTNRNACTLLALWTTRNTLRS